MAGKTKLTDAIEKTICDAVAVGLTYESAGEYAGVSRRTVRYWMEWGEQKPHSRYAAFLHAVQQANARARINLLAKIQKAAGDEWRAAAWILERRFADEFGTAMKVTHDVSDDLLKRMSELGLTHADIARDPAAVSLFRAAGLSVEISTTDPAMGAVTEDGDNRNPTT